MVFKVISVRDVLIEVAISFCLRLKIKKRSTFVNVLTTSRVSS